jgi:hypothetical protein
VQGGKHVMVVERLKYLRDHYYGRYEISSTHNFYPDQKMFVVHSTLTIHFEEGSRSYQGLGQEVVGGGNKSITLTKALEKAQTTSVGRACAMAGIGIEESIASAEEMEKSELLREARVSEAVDEELGRDKHKTEFLKRLEAVATPEALTELTREAQAETDVEMKEFKLAAIKLAAKSLGYKAVKNVGFTSTDATGAEVSRKKGDAATQEALNKLTSK